jgi:hypothetical protein
MRVGVLIWTEEKRAIVYLKVEFTYSKTPSGFAAKNYCSTSQ